MTKNLRETIKLIEKLSLIKVHNYELVEKRLQQSINSANKLMEVDINNVEPLYTVLEDLNLDLRKNEPVETNSNDIFKNAKRIEHGYFVLELPKDK